MKKILSTLVFGLAAITTFAEAQNIDQLSANFNGFYVGGGAGINMGEAQINSNTFATYDPKTAIFLNSLTNNADQNSTNAIGQLFLGYGRNFNPLYLGAEFYGAINSFNTSVTKTATLTAPTANLTNTTKVGLNNGEFGIDLRPGFVLGSNTLIYGRIGAAFNRIKLSSDSSSNQFVTPTVSAISNLSYNTNKSKTGLRLGLGLEEMITAHFSLRGDYIFTDYGKASGNDVAAFSPSFYSGDSLQNKSSTTLYTNTVMVSASYYFGSFI